MIKGGLVRRTPDPDDGRYTLATLTGAGRALVTEAAPGHVENPPLAEPPEHRR